MAWGTGPGRLPVSSIKSMVGHSLGAIGSIELAVCSLTLDRQVVPTTANLHNADPECDLDYVPLVAREHRVDTVLSVGSGFGASRPPPGSAAVEPWRDDRRSAEPAGHAYDLTGAMEFSLPIHSAATRA